MKEGTAQKKGTAHRASLTKYMKVSQLRQDCEDYRLPIGSYTAFVLN